MMHTAVPSRCLPAIVPRAVNRIEKGLPEAWKPLLSVTSSLLGKYCERCDLKRHSEDDVGNGLVMETMTSYRNPSKKKCSLDLRVLRAAPSEDEGVNGTVTRSVASRTVADQEATRRDQESVSQNRPTKSMWPVGSSDYAQAPQNRRFKRCAFLLTMTVVPGQVSDDVMKGYLKLIGACADVYRGKGVVGYGLFARNHIRDNSWICEYTGVRLSGVDMKRMIVALEYHGMDDNTLVEVPSEEAVIDPGVVVSSTLCEP